MKQMYYASISLITHSYVSELGLDKQSYIERELVKNLDFLLLIYIHNYVLDVKIYLIFYRVLHLFTFQTPIKL